MNEWKTVQQPPKWHELLVARLILLDGRPGLGRTLFGSPWKRIAWFSLLGLLLGWLIATLLRPAPVGEPVPADLVIRGKKAAYTLRAPGAHWRIQTYSEEGTAGDVRLIAPEGEVIVLVSSLPPGTSPEALREPLLDYLRKQFPNLTAVDEGSYTHLRLSAKDEALMRFSAAPKTCCTILFLVKPERFASLRPLIESTLASFQPL